VQNNKVTRSPPLEMGKSRNALKNRRMDIGSKFFIFYPKDINGGREKESKPVMRTMGGDLKYASLLYESYS